MACPVEAAFLASAFGASDFASPEGAEGSAAACGTGALSSTGSFFWTAGAGDAATGAASPFLASCASTAVVTSSRNAASSRSPPSHEAAT